MRRIGWVWLGLALLPIPAVAAEPPPGASTCSGCHAAGGMVAITGRPAAETVAIMAAFRSGARPATLMNRLVKGFSPEEIQAIAAWLEAQR